MKKKFTNNTKIFYANMKWFEVAEQPQSIEDLPEVFKVAKSLWIKDKNKNIKQVIKLLNNFIGARFLPHNIPEWDVLFADPDGEGCPEYKASEVRVVGIDFSSSPFPKCKAEAVFNIKVTDQFSSVDLNQWQENDGEWRQFSDGVIFYWDVPKSDSMEDLDFTCGDNEGVECIVSDKNPFNS